MDSEPDPALQLSTDSETSWTLVSKRERRRLGSCSSSNTTKSSFAAISDETDDAELEEAAGFMTDSAETIILTCDESILSGATDLGLGENVRVISGSNIRELLGQLGANEMPRFQENETPIDSGFSEELPVNFVAACSTHICNYFHEHNSRLNWKLTLISLLAAMFAIGLGVGHYGASTKAPLPLQPLTTLETCPAPRHTAELQACALKREMESAKAMNLQARVNELESSISELTQSSAVLQLQLDNALNREDALSVLQQQAQVDLTSFSAQADVLQQAKVDLKSCKVELRRLERRVRPLRESSEQLAVDLASCRAEHSWLEVSCRSEREGLSHKEQELVEMQSQLDGALIRERSSSLQEKARRDATKQLEVNLASCKAELAEQLEKTNLSEVCYESPPSATKPITVVGFDKVADMFVERLKNSTTFAELRELYARTASTLHLWAQDVSLHQSLGDARRRIGDMYVHLENAFSERHADLECLIGGVLATRDVIVSKSEELLSDLNSKSEQLLNDLKNSLGSNVFGFTLKDNDAVVVGDAECAAFDPRNRAMVQKLRSDVKYFGGVLKHSDGSLNGIIGYERLKAYRGYLKRLAKKAQLDREDMMWWRCQQLWWSGNSRCSGPTCQQASSLCESMFLNWQNKDDQSSLRGWIVSHEPMLAVIAAWGDLEHPCPGMRGSDWSQSQTGIRYRPLTDDDDWLFERAQSRRQSRDRNQQDDDWLTQRANNRKEAREENQREVWQQQRAQARKELRGREAMKEWLFDRSIERERMRQQQKKATILKPNMATAQNWKKTPNWKQPSGNRFGPL